MFTRVVAEKEVAGTSVDIQRTRPGRLFLDA